MRERRPYGTPENPVLISDLPLLAKCPGLLAMLAKDPQRPDKPKPRGRRLQVFARLPKLPTVRS